MVETRCTSGGIDHGFINWLVYGMKLRTLLRVKVFPQGEGALNTLGGLRPNTVAANITGPLRAFWRVLDADGRVLNWSGELSPVVHQLDHFLEELEGIVDNEGINKGGSAVDRGWQAVAAARCLWGCADSHPFALHP